MDWFFAPSHRATPCPTSFSLCLLSSIQALGTILSGAIIRSASTQSTPTFSTQSSPSLLRSRPDSRLFLSFSHASRSFFLSRPRCSHHRAVSSTSFSPPPHFRTGRLYVRPRKNYNCMKDVPTSYEAACSVISYTISRLGHDHIQDTANMFYLWNSRVFGVIIKNLWVIHKH